MGQAAYDEPPGPSGLRGPYFGSVHAAAPWGSGDCALPKYVPKPSTSTPGEATTVAEVFEVSDDDDQVVQPNLTESYISAGSDCNNGLQRKVFTRI